MANLKKKNEIRHFPPRNNFGHKKHPLELSFLKSTSYWGIWHCIPGLFNISILTCTKNAVFCPWGPWPLTFKHVRVRDQTYLQCEFGANPFSGSRDISHTNKKKTTDWLRQKQNLQQFTVVKIHVWEKLKVKWNQQVILRKTEHEKDWTWIILGQWKF